MTERGFKELIESLQEGKTSYATESLKWSLDLLSREQLYRLFDTLECHIIDKTTDSQYEAIFKETFEDVIIRTNILLGVETNDK